MILIPKCFFFLDPETVVQKCSEEKVFLEISQNWQENACARDSLNKVAGLRPATLFKKSL